MNQTKTAVIIGIVSVAMLGVIIYLLRDNFSKKVELTDEGAPQSEE